MRLIMENLPPTENRLAADAGIAVVGDALGAAEPFEFHNHLGRALPGHVQQVREIPDGGLIVGQILGDVAAREAQAAEAQAASASCTGAAAKPTKRASCPMSKSAGPRVLIPTGKFPASTRQDSPQLPHHFPRLVNRESASPDAPFTTPTRWCSARSTKA